MSRITVYTAIFGGKDEYMEPAAGAPYESILFTDDPPAASRTDVVKVDPSFLGPRRTSRSIKILSHMWVPGKPEYAVWMDGSIVHEGVDIPGLCREFLRDSPLAAFHHPHRYCVYDEAECAVKLGISEPVLLGLQTGRYRKEGYPVRNGLALCGILFRRTGDPALKEFERVWWEEVAAGSDRDQVSFGYSAWKTGLRYTVIRHAPEELGFIIRGHSR